MMQPGCRNRTLHTIGIRRTRSLLNSTKGSKSQLLERSRLKVVLRSMQATMASTRNGKSVLICMFPLMVKQMTPLVLWMVHPLAAEAGGAGEEAVDLVVGIVVEVYPTPM